MSENANGFRRFGDRVMYSACALVLMLTGVIWAVTWRNTSGDVEKLKVIQQNHAERVKGLEGDVTHLQRDVSEIKGDVKQILKEVRK